MAKSQDYSFLPPPRILTRGGFAFSFLLFTLCLLTFLFGAAGIANADVEWDSLGWDSLNTFYFDNFDVSQQLTGNNIGTGVYDNDGRFGDGLLGGLTYSVGSSSASYTVVGKSGLPSRLVGKGDLNTARGTPSVNFNFGNDMGTSTVAEEGSRLYEISFKIRPAGMSDSSWGSFIFGLDESDRFRSLNSTGTGHSGFGILFRGNKGMQAFDDTNGSQHAISVSGTYSLSNDNYWANVKIQFVVNDFVNDEDNRVDIRLLVNDTVITTFQTDKGFANNFIQFQTLSRSESYYTDFTVKSSANYNYDVSNDSVFALDKNWTTNGLDKRDVVFLSARDGASEADHTGTVALGADTEFNVASGLTLTQSGVISGTGVLNKTGEGTLTLTNANTYEGETTISEGTLKLSGAGTLGTDTVTNSGTLEFAHTDDITFSNVISGSGAVTKTGTGTLTFSGVNTYDGGTTISGGTLKLTGAGTLGTGAVTVGENAALEIAYDTPNTPVNISSVTMTTGDVFNAGSAFKVPSGAVTFGTENVALNNLSGGSLGANGQIAVPATLTVTGKLTLNNDAMSKFIGSISAETIEKTGDGTLQLYSSAANMISAESLVISSGRVDIKEYFKGQLEVKSGATLSPGNSVGTLEIDPLIIGESTYGGGFILNEEGATLLMEIGGQTPEENDMLIVNGPLSIDKGIIYLALADENNFTSGMDFEAQIQAGTDSDNYVDAITNALVPGWPFYNLSVTQSGNVYSIHGTYDPNAVPEPSTWALLLLGAAGLLYVRKRKN